MIFPDNGAEVLFLLLLFSTEYFIQAHYKTNKVAAN